MHSDINVKKFNRCRPTCFKQIYKFHYSKDNIAALNDLNNFFVLFLRIHLHIHGFDTWDNLMHAPLCISKGVYVCKVVKS